MGSAAGLRAHSGWAALVCVGAPLDRMSVLDRRRIEFADPSIDGSWQPYHKAETLPLAQAESFVKRCRDRSDRLAREALEVALEAVAALGKPKIDCVAILVGKPRDPMPLKDILASHARIHAAEGIFFREVLARAAGECRLKVWRLPEEGIRDAAMSQLGLSGSEIDQHLSAVGKTIGPPWRQDQKLSALAGWLALAASAEASSGRRAPTRT